MFVNNVPNNEFSIVGNNVVFTQNITGTAYGVYSDNFTALNLVSLTNKIYTITNNPTNRNIILFVNGVIQPSANYTTTSTTLTVNSTDFITHLSAWIVDDTIGVDDVYSIVYNSNNDKDVIPAEFKFNIVGGELTGVDIVYAGLHYPRYMMLAVEGVADPAKILLECLNGSIVRAKIIDAGSGLTNTNYTTKLYYYGQIESEHYCMIESDVSIIV
jgi:hypothetical protein